MVSIETSVPLTMIDSDPGVRTNVAALEDVTKVGATPDDDGDVVLGDDDGVVDGVVEGVVEGVVDGVVEGVVEPPPEPGSLPEAAPAAIPEIEILKT